MLGVRQESIAGKPPALDEDGEPIRKYVWFSRDDDVQSQSE